MGARAPVKKLRSNTLKCEFCNRQLLSSAALHSHQQCVHGAAMKARARARPNKIGSSAKAKPKTSLKSVPKTPKPEADIIDSMDIKEEPASLEIKNESHSKDADDQQTKDTSCADQEEAIPTTLAVDIRSDTKFLLKPNRIFYQCPLIKCKKNFSVYFPAFKHIEKAHNNHRGWDKLRPVQVETCCNCIKTFHSSEYHCCDNGLSKCTQYICLQCNDKQRTMKTCDAHIRVKHSDAVESWFFPTKEDFLYWQSQIEFTTKIVYKLAGTYDSKILLRCSKNHISKLDPELVYYYCPSTIMIQLFSKGIQVHYYPNHSDHFKGVYQTITGMDDFLITTITDNTMKNKYMDKKEEEPEEENTDLYALFVHIMSRIIEEAKETDVNNLKLVMEMALDMAAILNIYKSEAKKNLPSSFYKRKLSDDQITEVLQDYNRMENQKKVKFASRHKDSFNHMSNLTEGTASPKLVDSFSLSIDNLKKALNNLNEQSENAQNKSNTQSPKHTKQPNLKSPPSYNDTFKDFLSQNCIPVVTAKKPKRNVLKTKMGQFKPNSPKRSPVVQPVVKTELLDKKIKIEKYEVVEQDDDCNILVLKI